MAMHDVLIVGAGPSGLATAIAAKQRGLDALIVEKGVLVNSVFRFPVHMVFFTTPELLEIGGLPLTTPFEKPTRLEALRYYRRVVETYGLAISYRERVEAIPAGQEDQSACDRGSEEGRQVGRNVKVGAADVQALPLRPRQEGQNAEVDRNAGHGDRNHDDCLDLGRLDQPADRGVDDQERDDGERDPVRLGGQDLGSREAERPAAPRRQ